MEKILFATIGVCIGLYAYGIYIRDMYAGDNKPHAFSWMIWSLTTGSVLYAQIQGGAGVGSWIVGISFLVCVFITIMSRKHGTREIRNIDRGVLLLALTGMFLMFQTSNLLWGVFLLTSVDVLGYIPTFVKSRNDPYHEMAESHFLTSLKYLFGILALEKYSILTALYPVSIGCMSCALYIYLRLRKNKVDPVLAGSTQQN